MQFQFSFDAVSPQFQCSFNAVPVQCSFNAISMQFQCSFSVISPWQRAVGEARSSEAMYSGFSLDDTVRRFPFIAKTGSCFLRLCVCPGDVLDGCLGQVF